MGRRFLLGVVAAVAAIEEQRVPQCPSERRFYVYETQHANNHTSNLDRLQLRFLTHPCRTMLFTNDVHAVVSLEYVRAFLEDPYGQKLPQTLATERLLLSMPPEIANHPRLYFVCTYPIQTEWPFVETFPDQATFFTIEPAYKHQGQIVPWIMEDYPPKNEADGCYEFVQYRGSHNDASTGKKKPKVIGIPYFGWGDEKPKESGRFHDLVDIVDGPRAHEALYYGGHHGLARKFRKRLDTIATMTTKESWIVISDNKHSTVTREEFFDMMHTTDFCLCPTGDSPSRGLAWDGLRRGCIPVFFSTCTKSVNQAGYTLFLENDEPHFFAQPGKWSILLNETKAALDETYVSTALAAISEETKRYMRDYVRKIRHRISFSDDPFDLKDAGATIVKYMIERD